MGNSKSKFTAPDYSARGRYYQNTMALLKLRENYASRVSKVPSGAFRSIVEYCAPTEWENGRVSDHYKYNEKYPLNYSWPE